MKRIEPTQVKTKIGAAVILGGFFLLNGCAYKEGWRDNCERNFSEESLSKAKCKERTELKKKAEATGEAQKKEADIRLESLDIPRTQRGMGRSRDAPGTSTGAQ